MYRLRQKEAELLLSIIERLNQGDDIAGMRRAIGEDLLRLMQADYLASFVWNDVHQRFEEAVAFNMSPDNLARYETYYQFRDPITPLLQRHRKATLVTAVMPQDELMRTEFYNDFLQRDGLHTGINVYAYDGDRNIGDLRIWRGRHHLEMGLREVRLLEMLRPHFTNALRNIRSLHQERSLAQGWQELWEEHPNPCFVFDANRNEVHRNSAARVLFVGLSGAARTDLFRFLAAAQTGSDPEANWAGFRYTIARSPGEDRPAIAGLTLIQLVAAERSTVDRGWLQRTFQLTKREAEVCLLAVKGLTDQQIAHTLDISFWTVRTHLDHVFRKCSASGRAELIHALFGGLIRFET